MQRIDGWSHVYRRSNGSLYYVRRPPTDVADCLPTKQFRRSLKHRDERAPAFKAAYDIVHSEVEACIAKLRKGLSAPQAQQDYDQAVLRAQRLGFDYRPMNVLADDKTNIEDLIDRLVAIEAKIGNQDARDVDAVLGAVPQPKFTFADALEVFVELSKPELRAKNDGQRKRWRNPLDLAVRNFTEVVGARTLNEITRNDALAFRSWWVDERLGNDVGSANTANKNLMALRKIFRVVNDAHRLGLDNPFDGLSIGSGAPRRRVSLTRELLEESMLTDQALSGLNSEARGVVLAMADTGARVNEITGLEPDDIVLDAPVPHLIIRPNEIRSLKTAHSERVIPLIGVALAAMKRNPGGFPRYAAKNASASGAINKYLRERKLLPDGATLYGLRHGFQDRLIEVEAPERIQADLMGHGTLRPKYGKGPSLGQMHEWLGRIALAPISP